MLPVEKLRYIACSHVEAEECGSINMAAYWPNSSEPFAPPMDQIPKVVFSKTLKHADWGETQIASGDLAQEI